MSSQTKRLSWLKKFDILFFLMLGIMFASFVIAIFAKFGWPKDATDWFVISAYTFLSALFFTGAYLGRKISKP